ncbi:NAD(P)-dependent oxidoreductase [Candidatus Daviesbacteria bacterium]|nr:NAD(P)-dependent oxidoreductase [Candidatus Daviesbacteria bacterium]
MKVLIFGGSGLVGSKFIDLYRDSFEIESPDATEVDILNKDAVEKAVEEFAPDTVINFAAYTQVEEAENQKDDKEGICYQINAIGAKNVAEACSSLKKKLVHISTDYVFDGSKDTSPYTEEDKPNPINWYGKTKYFAEQLALESGCPLLIARICMPFSPNYELKKDIARFFLEQLRAKKEIKAVEDQKITPTLVSDIAAGLKTLIDADKEGLYHVSSTDSMTPLEFAKTIAELFGLEYSLIGGVSLDEYNKNKKAKMLKYSWLNPAKFEEEFGEGILHTIEEGLVSFKEEIDAKANNPI